MEYLYIICIGLLFFFSFSLFTKKNKPLSEKIFSLWIALLLLTVVSFLVYVKGQAANYPVFISMICDSHVLHGSFLYIYILAFTHPSFRLKKKHLIHLVPVFLLLTYKFSLNFLTGDMHCYREGGCIEEDNAFVNITYFYKYFILGLYIILTWRLVLKYRKNATSPRETMRCDWVKQIATGVTFLYLGILLLQAGRFLYPELFWERMLLANTLTTLFIFVFLYLGNSYAYIFVSPSKSRFKNLSEASENPAPKVRDEKTDELKQVMAKLDAFMEKERPYLRSQLTLKDLSEICGVPSAVISQAVNKTCGKSVTDYINEYRVNELKKRLTDPSNRHYKIMIVASECGFNSKSTLSRIFKQHAGCTPGEYLKSQTAEV